MVYKKKNKFVTIICGDPVLLCFFVRKFHLFCMLYDLQKMITQLFVLVIRACCMDENLNIQLTTGIHSTIVAIPLLTTIPLLTIPLLVPFQQLVPIPLLVPNQQLVHSLLPKNAHKVNILRFT